MYARWYVIGRRPRTKRPLVCPSRLCSRNNHTLPVSPYNLLQIQKGTFYHEHPSSFLGSDASKNPPFFQNLNFSLFATPASDVGQPLRKDHHWAVIGANDTTTFLNVLRGNLICIPPKARTYPYLSSNEIIQKDPRLSLPSRAIQYVGFNSKNATLGQASAGVQGAYLSARYESRREETDWTVLQYLQGRTELNPSEELHKTLKSDDPLLQQVIHDLQMDKLLNMPVSNLSNGQTRRSRIAKALLSKPELLLLDEPFMGLDPPTLVRLSPMLKRLAWRSGPLLLLALRPQDPIPDWITHLVILGGKRSVVMMGEKSDVLFGLRRWDDLYRRDGIDAEGKQWLKLMTKLHGIPLAGVGDSLTDAGVLSYRVYDHVMEQEKRYFDGSHVRCRVLEPSRQKMWEVARKKQASHRTLEEWLTVIASLPSDLKASLTARNDSSEDTNVSSSMAHSIPSSAISATHNQSNGRTLIELQDLVLKYGDKTILGHPPPQPGFSQPGLNLTIREGTRLALLGPNGSGKTTLLSLLTSDHPQSYSLPMKFFGRSRLPSKGVPGLSLWEIQNQIGHSSPEVHAFFPKTLTIRRVLESSWAETFSSVPALTAERTATIDAVLRWWEPELRQSVSPASSSQFGSATLASHKSDTENNKVKDDDLSWARSTEHPFSTLPFGTQRLLLLLRALIKKPKIIILDEAFSGLSSQVRDKAMDFLEQGTTNTESNSSTKIPDAKTSANSKPYSVSGLSPQQALVVVSHLREEIPDSINEWIRLPSEEEAVELGKSVEMGWISEGETDTDVDTDSNTSSSALVPDDKSKGNGKSKSQKSGGRSGGIKDLKAWNRVWGL